MSVALTAVEPSMTWLLVSTRPSERITMPVPAADSLLYCSVVSMITRPGWTLFRIACSLALDEDPPLLGVGAGVNGVTGVCGTMALLLGCGVAELLDAGWYRATTVPAPRAPAATATAR